MSSFPASFWSLLVFISMDDSGFPFLVDLMIVRALKIMFLLLHCSIGVHENVLAYKNFPCLF